MRLDGKEDCKISKISFVSFTFRATIYPLWREIRKNVTQIHTKTIDKHLHEPFDHTVKCGLFSDFQYGFRSSRATADRLAVVSNRIARAFSRSLATRTVALDMPKAFNRVWHVGLLHKLKSYGTSGQIFLIINGFEWFWIGSLHKNTLIMLEFLKAPFLALHFCYFTFSDLRDYVICNMAIYVDTTVYSKCDQASDLWQQLE